MYTRYGNSSDKVRKCVEGDDKRSLSFILLPGLSAELIMSVWTTPVESRNIHTTSSCLQGTRAGLALTNRIPGKPSRIDPLMHQATGREPSYIWRNVGYFGIHRWIMFTHQPLKRLKRWIFSTKWHGAKTASIGPNTFKLSSLFDERLTDGWGFKIPWSGNSVPREQRIYVYRLAWGWNWLPQYRIIIPAYKNKYFPIPMFRNSIIRH